MDSRIDDLRRKRAAGEHLSALKLAQELLREPAELSMRERVLVSRQGFLAATALEEYHQATRLAEAGLDWATQSKDPALIAAAAYHAGSAMLNQGAWAQAREQLEGFLATEPASETVHYRAPALFNLGLALVGQRRYREAVDRFREAEVAFAGDMPNVARCLLEAAWAELRGGRPEPAGLYLDRAIDALGDDADPALQATCLCHRAFYHWQVKEYDAAINLCREATLPKRAGVTAHHKAEAAWIAAECAITLGSRELAAQLAAVAMDEAVKSRLPYLMNQASDLHRRIKDAESA